MRDLLPCLLLLTPGVALGQPAPECEGGTIRRIGVRPREVFDDSGGAVLSKLYTVANWLHVETREQVIRRELLFREGECNDPFLLRESERLLRDFQFIKEASIQTVPRRNQDVDVVVATNDDWSLRFEPRVDVGSGLGFTGIELAERNLWGSGRSIEFTYIDRAGPDQVGGAFIDPQFLGSRWNLELRAARTEPGWAVRGLIGYPFVALVGRWAAFQDVGYSETWFRYIVGESEQRTELIEPVVQMEAQVGAAMRVKTTPRGASTKLGTYGLSLSYERLEFDPAFFDDSTAAARAGLSDDEAAALLSERLTARETVRLNLLIGVRGFEFVERSGLTTLQAEEDIPLGASADFTIGLATRAFGSTDSHVLGAADVYAGARMGRGWYSLLRASFEARRDYVARDWRDIFGALQWTNLWLLNSRNTFALTGRWAAGWDTTVPFQLTLGGPSGLAGYAAHRYPGGASTVVRAENRTYLKRVGRLLDLGSVIFADLGRMWANDSPFGTNSGFRASLGAGIRLATPAGSRLTYRLEIAAPVDAHLSADDLVITFTTQRPLRLEGRPANLQLERSRDTGLLTAGRHVK